MTESATPEPVDWTLSAQGTAAAISLTREEARGFARALLAAAGDATERTFPHPPIEGTDA